ncbi:MAG: TetR/AcrR family transcriptional regulator [Verrucomicrobiaceae bacterium]
MSATVSTPIKLQEALFELMWSQSYGRVTIDAICERAGVKKGSFYHAYPDKAALALDSFEHHWNNHSRPWLDEIFSSSQPPLSRISAWLAGGLNKSLECHKLHGQIHGCPLFNVGSELSTLEPAVADKIADILGRIHRYLTTALRDAVAENLVELDDAAEVARDVLTLVEGALTQARISNDAAPIRRLTFSVSRLIGSPLPELQNSTTS